MFSFRYNIDRCALCCVYARAPLTSALTLGTTLTFFSLCDGVRMVKFLQSAMSWRADLSMVHALALWSVPVVAPGARPCGAYGDDDDGDDEEKN